MRRERPVRLCSAHPARHESDHDPSGLPSVVSYAELLLSGPRPRRGGRPRGPRGILLGRRVPGARGDGAAQPGSRRRLADPGDGSRGRWPGPIVLSAGHGGVPLWRLLRGERRPVGSDPHVVRRGIRPRGRSRMGHLRPPGPDQGHAHPELFARFGSRAGFRPAAPLRSRRDREFHLDRAATDDLPRRPGVANRSLSASLAYLTQHRVTIGSGSDGSVSYTVNGTTRTLKPNSNETFFVARGSLVNLTAQPASLFYVFSGWTGDLAGTESSGSLTMDQPRSVAARFSPNWSFIAALATIVAIAAVSLLVFVLRRKRRSRPPQEQALLPPSPPEGPSP